MEVVRGTMEYLGGIDVLKKKFSSAPVDQEGGSVVSAFAGDELTPGGAVAAITKVNHKQAMLIKDLEYATVMHDYEDSVSEK